MLEILEELITIIRQRKGSTTEESYTKKLLNNKNLNIEKTQTKFMKQQMFCII